jgi:sugar phosphate permease
VSWKPSRNVWALSLTSLLTDVSSEMVLPLLPSFITTVLGGGPAALGRMEGVAEAVSSLLKLWSGRQVDGGRPCRPWILAGYGFSGFIRPLMGMAGSTDAVVLIRAGDRVGKGLRTSPRDVLLGAAAPPEHRAQVFSFHRAMDHAGAVIGSLLGWVALSYLQWDLRTIFYAAALPGLLAFGVLLLGLKEEARPEEQPKKVEEKVGLPRSFWWFLAATAVLGLGAGSEGFLLLAAGGSDVPLSGLPLLWMGLHIVKSISSLWAGPVADRLGHMGIFLSGKMVHILVFIGFAYASLPLAVVLLFLIHGLHHGLAEGSEKALVADWVPPALRGRAFGAWNLVTGLVALPAAMGFGMLWEEVSRPTAFLVAVGLSLFGMGMMLAIRQLRPAV